MSEEKSGYEFINTQDGDIMLMIYARNTDANAPVCRLIAPQGKIILKRNEEDSLTLQDVEMQIFENLENEETLLICEFTDSQNPQEKEIIRAYEATIVR